MVEQSARVHRTTSGVHPPEPPAARWNPGVRYRRSLLTRTTASIVPAPGAATPSTDAAAPLAPGERAASWALPGRLFRGPAARKAVFDRPVWAPYPGGSQAPPPQGHSAELADAVARYRRGALSTTGLVRAVGHALAA
ncbi:conserved hypothetical protein [Xylanimonas cellulosilytica DSM 15894]|uniref:Uncharacterized protein n=1 Tax=Xylanimonas cellulosilytica (strain DSM 15894 / JCM 12276 / CECT 5975 / KCTC 9989 / LMG 20990 / NBRC 107835 / XIL07) TaxID=446471 RepID=D1BSU7_XYLCX|nr:hypothetical protein [Xylanimonas cellulosilytica]ACZ30789.1 conserved hypothetical protein [Xylanimonas cellulosilytica DSM 15894]